MKKSLVFALLLAGAAWNSAAHAATTDCSGENTVLAAVPEAGECLRFTAYGKAKADTLLVWLHGDVSNGGPAVYHRAMAERAIADHTDLSLASVALVRPGYPDDSGEYSSGELNNRRDHYTVANMERVATAVGQLRIRYGASRVILIGHSGGAATAANVLGMYPSAAEDAIIAACPCDLSTWRATRGNAWPNSVDPINETGGIRKTAKVLALTAQGDTNTGSYLADSYVQVLQTRGVTGAEFRLVTNPDFNTHNGVFRSPELRTALADLLKPADDGGETETPETPETPGTDGGTTTPTAPEATSGQDSGGGGALAWLLLPLAWAGWRRRSNQG